MATTSALIACSIVSFAQLVVSADLINLYGGHFPSGAVRSALIFAPLTSVWGTVLGIVLPVLHRRLCTLGAVDTATPTTLFATSVVELVAAILLARAAADGNACFDKKALTCRLYTAVLAMEWIMVAFSAGTMTLASVSNTRTALRVREEMAYV